MRGHCKVFTDADGLEPFASTFTLVIEFDSGETEQIVMTPEFYRRLKGPYNRRNAYGAALAYAPRLPRPLWESLFSYGFSEHGPLRSELQLPEKMVGTRVIIETNTRGRTDRWELTPP
jgi:hypothetical protein